jgi:FkbM family methyltransferase
MDDFMGSLDFFSTRYGNYFLPKNSEKDIVCRDIRSDKVFDSQIVTELKNIYISRGDPDAIMLDVGANFGQMSILFSSFPQPLGVDTERSKPKPLVYSFEAEPYVSKVLALNIAANRLTEKIKVIDKAVWWKDGQQISFPPPDFLTMDSWGSYGLDPNDQQGRIVDSVTIDSFNFSDTIAFMKVDIQGSDLSALKGAKSTIQKWRMPIIFEYEEMFSSKFKAGLDDYLNFVQEINYYVTKVIANNYLIESRV